MILHYFLVGMKEVFSYDIVRTTVIILVLLASIVIYRRISIIIQSGGSFCSSHKIADGFFYIHSGIVPGNRKILLKNISKTTIHLLRGRGGNGYRYHIELVMKNGKNKAFMVGQSKKAEVEIAEMQKQLNKNKIKIHYYDYTKL